MSLCDLMQQNSTWLLGKVIVGNISGEADHNSEVDEDQVESLMQLPSWVAYNSLLSKELPITHVETLPLIAAPVHGQQSSWSLNSHRISLQKWQD